MGHSNGTLSEILFETLRGTLNGTLGEYPFETLNATLNGTLSETLFETLCGTRYGTLSETLLQRSMGHSVGHCLKRFLRCSMGTLWDKHFLRRFLRRADPVKVGFVMVDSFVYGFSVDSEGRIGLVWLFYVGMV